MSEKTPEPGNQMRRAHLARDAPSPPQSAQCLQNVAYKPRSMFRLLEEEKRKIAGRSSKVSQLSSAKGLHICRIRMIDKSIRGIGYPMPVFDQMEKRVVFFASADPCPPAKAVVKSLP